MNSIGLRHFSVVRRIVVRMASTNSSYEDAICKLNSLQSNKATIEQIKKGLKTGQKCANLEDMERYLRRVGIPLSKLDELSVIHVAGTKGKGSTSAMCESILRRHGFRTGFYSSPHLVSARERIRLEGRPLAREQFALHLQRVYRLLRDSQEFEGDMPKYFAFLTVVAFHVFLLQRVEVAVVEVGIGGVVDYTNVLRRVPVVGITALGLDHTSILGHSLPEIAAAKAGIMKRGCDAYTVRQPSEALAVLVAHASNVECPLTVVPEYTSYTFPDNSKSYLPVDLDAYRTNASLAIQLSHAWIRATQANSVRNHIASSAINTKNGLHCDMNDTRNGTIKGLNSMKEQRNSMQKEENGMKMVTIDIKKDNEIINRDANQVNSDINELNPKIINGVHKIQNESMNSALVNGIRYDGLHITNGRDNGLQDIIVTQNGTITAQNSTIATENSTIVTQNSTIVTQNSTIMTQNSTIATQNGTIATPKGKVAAQCNTNGIQNGTDKAQNGLINDNIMGKLVLEVPYETAEGLKQCKWPGRYHVVESDYAKFYLDGAHTKESMEICAQWFTDSCSSSNKILIFSTTGDRDAATLLRPLSSISFTHVYFVKPTAYEETAKDHDNFSLVERQELSHRCMKHAQIWHKLASGAKISVLECVADAFISIKAKGDAPAVLITGSLHLVGAALTILDPNLGT